VLRTFKRQSKGHVYAVNYISGEGEEYPWGLMFILSFQSAHTPEAQPLPKNSTFRSPSHSVQGSSLKLSLFCLVLSNKLEFCEIKYTSEVEKNFSVWTWVRLSTHSTTWRWISTSHFNLLTVNETDRHARFELKFLLASQTKYHEKATLTWGDLRQECQICFN
jgi:hypothetical protein